MKLYLYSPIDTLARVDNRIIPLTRGNPLLAECENPFVEFLPGAAFCPSFTQIGKPNFSQNLKIYDFYDGKLVIPKLKRSRNLSYKKLFSKSQSYFGHELNISAICDGGIKLVLSGMYFHEEVELPFEPKEWNVIPHSDIPVIIVVLKNKLTAAVAISLPELKVLLQVVCDEVTFDAHLSATTHHKDICRHTITDVWKVSTPFDLQGRKISFLHTVKESSLIPYAFLEKVALGADYRQLLSDELAARANLIPDFIGKFSYYIPPINQHYPQTIALVCEKEIKLLSLRVENEKICDLNILD